jgi:predicted lipoprotein with Yx(FWY)xxD motif
MFITPMSITPNDEEAPTQAGTLVRSRKRTLVIGLLSAGLFLAACGSDDEAATPAADVAADADATDAAPAAVSISTGSTDAGDVLVSDGLSLYGFLPDEGGTPTCGGGCAEAWPPIMLPSADLPEGLDPAVFAVTDGIEGGSQLMAGGWPLYLFAGDAAPGDITGQGSGGNWFLVAPDGSLISDEAAAPAPTESDTSDDYDY